MRALVFMLLWVASTASALDYGLGIGVESRLTKDVNPAFSSVSTQGQFFQEVRFHPWTLTLELGLERGESASGGLSIERSTVSAQTWARFAVLSFDTWAPYVGVGVGGFFDRVTTRLPGDETDVRRGTRWMTGLGGGVTKTFFDHLLLEAELRASFVREQRDPGLSLLGRVGFLF